jgi:hypothetical protein
METYETVTEALTGLKAKGYTLDFNIAFDKISCSQSNACLYPNDFEITQVFRFEGDTDPGDEEAVYAIESTDGTLKGTLTAAYGTYADTVSTEILRKLSIHK